MRPKTFPWLLLEWRGPNANNSGRIRLSARQASAKMGVGISAAAAAFHSLQAKGFIAVPEYAHFGVSGDARAPSFEIATLQMPYSERPGGQRLFEGWQASDEFLMHMAPLNNPTGANGETKYQHQIQDSNVIIVNTKS